MCDADYLVTFKHKGRLVIQFSIPFFEKSKMMNYREVWWNKLKKSIEGYFIINKILN